MGSEMCIRDSSSVGFDVNSGLPDYKLDFGIYRFAPIDPKMVLAIDAVIWCGQFGLAVLPNTTPVLEL